MKLRLSFLIAIALGTQAAQAPTKTAVAQIACPASSSGFLVLVASLPNGATVCAKLANAVIDTTTTPPTISATAPAIPVFVFHEVPAINVSASGVTLTLQGAPNPQSSLQLFVNGVHWSPGADYTVAGNVVTIVPSQYQPSAGDSIEANYLR